MPIPPEGEVFRVLVDRKGGTEDGLTHNGKIHIKGSLADLPKGYAVKIIESNTGYAVGRVLDDVNPEEATNFYEWEQQQEQEELDPEQKTRDLQRFTPNSIKSEITKPWRKEEKQTDSEEDPSDSNFFGSKNDLIKDI